LQNMVVKIDFLKDSQGPSKFAKLARYYIQNSPFKVGLTVLMLLSTRLIRNKHFIDRIDDRNMYAFDLNQWIDKNLFFFGSYEKKELEFIKKYISKGSTFLDIGANSGIYSLALSEKCSKVIAFEPDPITRARLKQNIRINGIRNVKIIPHAVSDVESVAAFYINSTNRGMNSLFKIKNKRWTKKITVRTTTVDIIVKKLKLKNISFVKMDIEGGEFNALRGMVDTIKEFRPRFLIEINRAYTIKGGSKIESIFDFFLGLKYRAYSIKDCGLRRISKKEFVKIKQENIFFEPK